MPVRNLAEIKIICTNINSSFLVTSKEKKISLVFNSVLHYSIKCMPEVVELYRKKSRLG